MGVTGEENRPIRRWVGSPYPLGATYDGEGTNFSLFSSVADGVELCLCSADGIETRVELTEIDAFCWHAYPNTDDSGPHVPWSIVQVDDTFLLLFNAADADLAGRLPARSWAARWVQDLSTVDPEPTPEADQRPSAAGSTLTVASRSVLVLRADRGSSPAGAARTAPPLDSATYTELADPLADHALTHGFTHVELLPMMSTRATGAGVTSPGSLETHPVDSHGQYQSILLTVPPLAVVVLAPERR